MKARNSPLFIMIILVSRKFWSLLWRYITFYYFFWRNVIALLPHIVLLLLLGTFRKLTLRCVRTCWRHFGYFWKCFIIFVWVTRWSFWCVSQFPFFFSIISKNKDVRLIYLPHESLVETYDGKVMHAQITRLFSFDMKKYSCIQCKTS